MGGHTLCSRSGRVSCYIHRGVSLRSSKYPPDDHRPQMAPVYSGGCRTGRRRHRAAPGFLLYSCSHGNSPRRLFIQLSSVSFPSTPPDSSGAKKEFYWALKESPPGLEVLCLIGAKSSCWNPTGIASRVPIGDMLNYKSPHSSPNYGVSPGIRSFSPSRCNLPVRDHFKHEQFCLRNTVDIIFFDVHGSRA